MNKQPQRLSSKSKIIKKTQKKKFSLLDAINNLAKMNSDLEAIEEKELDRSSGGQRQKDSSEISQENSQAIAQPNSERNQVDGIQPETDRSLTESEANGITELDFIELSREAERRSNMILYPSGISEAFINKLEFYRIPNDLEDICIICCGELRKGQIARNLRCVKHIFHKNCIDKWMKRKASCPVCSKSVLPD